jgi:hypothetical protein
MDSSTLMGRRRLLHREQTVFLHYNFPLLWAANTKDRHPIVVRYTDTLPPARRSFRVHCQAASLGGSCS